MSVDLHLTRPMSCLIIERDCHDFLAPHCRIVICRPGVWASLSVVTRDRCVRAGSSLCVGSVTSISALCCSWRKQGWCAGVVCVGLVHACRANNAASVTLGRRRLNYRCEHCARLLAGNWTTRRQTNSPTDQLADNPTCRQPTRRNWNCHRNRCKIVWAHGRVFPVNLRKKSGAISLCICWYMGQPHWQ